MLCKRTFPLIPNVRLFSLLLISFYTLSLSLSLSLISLFTFVPLRRSRSKRAFFLSSLKIFMSLGVDESMWAAAMGDPIGIGPPHPEECKAGTSSQSQSQRKRHTKSCSNCKQLGHNKKTCQRSPVASSVRGKGRGTGTGRGMGQANHVKGVKRGTGRGRGNANATTSMVPLQMGGGRAAAPRRDATVEIPTTQASGVGTGSSAVGTTGFDVPTHSSGVVGSSTRAKGTSVWAAF